MKQYFSDKNYRMLHSIDTEEKTVETETSTKSAKQKAEDSEAAWNKFRYAAMRVGNLYGFFSHILYRLKVIEITNKNICPTMMTDGYHLAYNPDFVLDDLDNEEVIFVIAHEIMHNVLLHNVRIGDRRQIVSCGGHASSLWNIAGDYAINLLLDGIGKRPKSALYQDKYKGWSTEQIYDTLKDEIEKNVPKEIQKFIDQLKDLMKKHNDLKNEKSKEELKKENEKLKQQLKDLDNDTAKAEKKEKQEKDFSQHGTDIDQTGQNMKDFLDDLKKQLDTAKDVLESMGKDKPLQNKIDQIQKSIDKIQKKIDAMQNEAKNLAGINQNSKQQQQDVKDNIQQKLDQIQQDLQQAKNNAEQNNNQNLSNKIDDINKKVDDLQDKNKNNAANTPKGREQMQQDLQQAQQKAEEAKQEANKSCNQSNMPPAGMPSGGMPQSNDMPSSGESSNQTDGKGETGNGNGVGNTSTQNPGNNIQNAQNGMSDIQNQLSDMDKQGNDQGGQGQSGQGQGGDPSGQIPQAQSTSAAGKSVTDAMDQFDKDMEGVSQQAAGAIKDALDKIADSMSNGSGNGIPMNGDWNIGDFGKPNSLPDDQEGKGKFQGDPDLKKAAEKAGRGDKDDLEKQWQDITREAAMRNAGSGGAEFNRFLRAVSKPKVNWKAELRRFVATIYSKFRHVIPNRRYLHRDEYVYGMRKNFSDFEYVVVAIDTSGSIGQEDLNKFGAEIAAIAKEKGIQQLYVIYCDSEIPSDGIQIFDMSKPFSIEKMRPKGGGGTSFTPPFEWVNKNLIKKGKNPAFMIYFTDAQGSVEPKIAKGYDDRVMWVITYTDEAHHLKFGKKIFIDKL